MPRIKSTMAKMLSAQRSMIAAKVLSAMRPLPRLLRKSRTRDGPAFGAGPTGSEAKTAGGLGRMGDTGCDDLDSRSSVIRVEDTILFSCHLVLRVDFCSRLNPLGP